MAGGGDHPGANKRKHEAAGRPKRAKRKKPYEDPAARGGGGAKGKPLPVTAKDKRVATKEMSEWRKPDYNLEKELAVLWEGRDVSQDDIIRLVVDPLRKMDGKYSEVAGSHVNACVLQACVKWCSQPDIGKVGRTIIRILKRQIFKLPLSDYECLVVFQELTKQLKEQTWRGQLLQLLYALCSRYLTPTDLICLNYNVPSLISTDEASGSPTEVNLDSKLDDVAGEEHGDSEDTLVTSDSKKDPMKWRQELSVKSELCEALIETCIEHVGDLLRNNCLKGGLYEVSVGRHGNALGGVTDRIRVLHNAIASDAARSRTDDVEHAFDNRHSSRIIRRMILDCPAFAATLWKKALEGKCKLYANGFSSSTVVTAYLESPDSRVKDLAKSELQPLIDGGILKTPAEEFSAPTAHRRRHTENPFRLDRRPQRPPPTFVSPSSAPCNSPGTSN